MSFLGIGGWEFLLIFAVAMFLLGPKRLAEGVRSGRKYYTEFKRYRDELTSLVSEAIDAEDLKKEMAQVKKDAWDDGASKEIAGIEKDLTLDQGDLDVMRSVPVDRTSSRAKPINRGDGKVAGKEVPSMGLEPGDSSPTRSPGSGAEEEGPA